MATAGQGPYRGEHVAALAKKVGHVPTHVPPGMRLVRDEIARRVDTLAHELNG